MASKKVEIPELGITETVSTEVFEPIELELDKSYRRRNPDYCIANNVPIVDKIVFKTGDGKFIGESNTLYYPDGRLHDGMIDSEVDLVIETE